MAKSREIGRETEAPPHVRELVKACEDYVKRTIGTPLDGTSDTLPLLDHYLQNVDVKEPGPVVELVVSAAGAYFGEVVRHRFPSRWFAPVGEPFRWRIEFEAVFLHFNPIAVAFEAITRKDSGLGASYETLDADQAHLQVVFDSLPPVRLEDFYRLGVRLEVLDRVVAELTALALSRDDKNEWSAAEYRAIIDQPPS